MEVEEGGCIWILFLKVLEHESTEFFRGHEATGFLLFFFFSSSFFGKKTNIIIANKKYFSQK